MNKPYVYDQMFPILDACTTLNKIKILPNYVFIKFDLEVKIQPSISLNWKQSESTPQHPLLSSPCLYMLITTQYRVMMIQKLLI